MLKDIDTIDPNSGRILKEDNSVINLADYLVSLLDPMSGVVVYDELQHAIHNGEAFSYSMHGTLPSLGSLTLLGVSGAKQIHFDGMSISLQSGGVLMEFLEAPTVSAQGTLQSARRRNRAIGTSASNTLAIYSGATITGGTLIFDSLPPLISGQGNKIESSSSGIIDGWVLKQNTVYAIKLTNQNAVTVTFDANFGWHESTTLLA